MFVPPVSFIPSVPAAEPCQICMAGLRLGRLMDAGSILAVIPESIQDKLLGLRDLRDLKVPLVPLDLSVLLVRKVQLELQVQLEQQVLAVQLGQPAHKVQRDQRTMFNSPDPLRSARLRLSDPFPK